MNILKDTIITMLVLFSVYAVYHENELEKEYLKEVASLEAQLSVCDAEYNDSDEIIAHQQLVIKIMEDGASYKEAEDIITVSEEVGISPKY
jgi:antirestriction protein ArdC